jgi:hypothetical protein
MKIIAIIFPFLSFALRGKYFEAIVCLILQIFVISWLLAAFWAYSDLEK